MNKALLGAIVEVALKTSTFTFRRVDDPHPRRAELVELQLALGMQPLVLDDQSGGRDGLAKSFGIVEELGAMREPGDELGAAFHPCVRSARPGDQLDQAPVGIDQAPVAHRVCQSQARIAERRGEPIAQSARRRRTGEVEHDLRHLLPRAPGANGFQLDARRHRDERGRLAVPERQVERVIREVATLEGVHRVEGDADEERDAWHQHRGAQPT